MTSDDNSGDAFPTIRNDDTVRPDADLDAIGHYLIPIGGTERGAHVEIGDVAITIGRDARRTLAFDDSGISRLHACVSLVNGEAVAEDLGSTNGTFVDAVRIDRRTALRDGSVIRVGRQQIKYERRSRRDVDRAETLRRDLARARDYLLSLLPAPLTTGPVLADWRFVPSADLGGDAFGYDWSEPGTLVMYLIDVSGHGVGAAMHAVAVLNVLRQRALPHVDFNDPAAVLSGLNAMFPMEQHGDMYFTLWYGVYRVATRTLTYGSAGHHPAYVVWPDRQVAHPLGSGSPMIGASPDPIYAVREAAIPAGSALYLFSDGVFEIVTEERRRWSLSDFLPRILDAFAPGSEAERLYRTVRQAAGPGPLEDDFSLIAMTFP